MLTFRTQAESEGNVDLTRYSWALDLTQSFAGLREHAIEEAIRLHGGLTPAETRVGLVNLLLLMSAAEQVAADHVSRGGLDLSPIRERVKVAGVEVATRAAERLVAAATRVRGRIVEPDLSGEVKRLRSTTLELATALAAESGSAAWGEQVVEAFAGPRSPGLEMERCKIPACFRGQDLSVEDCFELARRFLESCPNPGRVLVVGVRTSGSYMAPLFAGWLRACGVTVEYLSMRPNGAHLQSLGAGWRRPDHAVVIDDPPMTGGSLVATASQLEVIGLPRERIRLAVAWSRENALEAGSKFRPRFDSYSRVELGAEEWSAARDLQSESIRRWIGGLCGRPPAAVSVQSSWPPPSEAGRAHLRQIFDVAGWGEVVVKGVGLGWYGYPARFAADRLSGRVPPVLGFRDGFMASRWLDSDPQRQPASIRVAGYVAAKAHALSLGRPAVVAGGPRRDGWYRLAQVLARVHGPLAPIAIGTIQKRLRAAARGGAACLVDGQIVPTDWLATQEEPGAFLKAGFEEHCFDKEDIDWPDPAYDLAGSVLAFGPSREAEAALLDAYIGLSGDRSAANRLGLGELLQGAISFDRQWWRAESAVGSFAWSAQVQRWLESEGALSWTIGRLLRGRPIDKRPSFASELWAIDVDGVLEDYGLGLPATTPAGVEAIARLRTAGAAIVLNTGRSPEEVLLRCDALDLDGGVAEYGSALAIRDGNRVISLLAADEAAALTAVRRRARELDGVHVDARYRNSVRVRARRSERLSALCDEQIAILLKAGDGLVEAVVGARQTDFKSRRRSKATGLADLIRETGFDGRRVAVGDGLADLPVALEVDRFYAPHGSHPALRKVAAGTRLRRQRGLLEAVKSEHPGPWLQSVESTPAEALTTSLIGLRDAPRAVRLVAALSQAGIEVFRC